MGTEGRLWGHREEEAVYTTGREASGGTAQPHLHLGL